MSRSFLDTNVLVYAEDADSKSKRDIARKLVDESVRSGEDAISTQVLQEYFAVSRKLKIPADDARRTIELLASQLHVVRIDTQDILAAIDLHRLHNWSFWDALIIRAALQAGCRVLYSEDLQAGRRIDGMEVVNPFSSVD